MASEDVLTWCDDLHQVKGDISQLQATLNHVFAKAPSVAQYKNLVKTVSDSSATSSLDPPLVEKLKVSLNSPQIKVAVKVKHLFDRGLLPFLKSLTKINFKSPKVDRYVGYLLDYQPLRKDIPSIGPEEPPKKHSVGDDQAPYPPALPPLENPLLLRLVLTDKSLRQPSDYLELQTEDGHHDFNNNHNRKLALHGARLLDLALLDALDEEFPMAHEDDLEYLKYKLTNGHMLAKLAYCYNFPESVMHNVSRELTSAEKLNIFKNVFLAYLGAMSKSHYSYDEIKMWVKKLYGPLMSRLHEESAKDEKLKNPFEIANAEFRFLVDRVNAFLGPGVKSIHYEFEFKPEESPLVCQLRIGDLHLGIGIGGSYVEAKKKAAFATFEDHELRTKFLEYLIEHYSSGNEGREAEKEENTNEKSKENKEPHEKEHPGQPDVDKMEHDDPHSSTGELAKGPDESEDEAYSPALNGEDEYEPAIPETITTPSVLSTSTNTASSASAAPTATTATNSVQATQTPSVSTSASRGPMAPAPAATSAVPAATSTASGDSYQRMPLPYGALPAIPNMKKRGPRR